MRMLFHVVQAAMLLCLSPLSSNSSASGQLVHRIEPGVVQDRITSPSDSGQRYAIYVPAAYDEKQQWPLALLLDPRGRALVPLELARPAAERLGYILISSYNTVSDSTAEPNFVAVRAMLADARRSFSVDERRIYLVGFSGTARLSWNLAVRFAPVRGILGAGGPGTVFARSHVGLVPPLSFFGIVGSTDFTYDEYPLFEPWLQRVGLAYRMRTFPGSHGWPPEPYLAAGLAWFKLRAMRDGLVQLDSVFVAEMFTQDTAHAHSLQRERAFADSYRRWQEIADDYSGLHDRAAAQQHVTRLSKDRRVSSELARRAAEAAAFGDYTRTVAQVADRLSGDVDSGQLNSMKRQLSIEPLLRSARGSDRATADAAQRRLEHTYVQLSFYLPRTLLERQQPALALLSLELAEAAKPGTARVSFMQAHALVQLQRPHDALSALEEAVERDLDPGAIAQTAAFASLQAEPRYRALLQRRWQRS